MRGKVPAALLFVAAMAWPLADARAQESDARAQAEALNEEGRQRIKQLDLEGAAARFRAAMQLVRDPRYAFNLCYTLEKSGKLQEARVACQDVVASGDERLSEKAGGLLQEIDAKLADKEPDVVEPDPPVESTPTPGEPQPPEPPAKLAEPAATRFAAVLGFVRSDVNGDFESSSKTGFAAGAGMKVKTLPSFTVVADLQFVQRGFTSPVAGLGSGLDVSLSYLDLGFAGRYGLGQSSVVTPYFEVGTVLSVLLSSSVSVDRVDGDGDFRAVDVAWALGAGMQVGSFDLRLRFLLGLLDISGDSNANADAGASPVTHRVTSVQGAFWF